MDKNPGPLKIENLNERWCNVFPDYSFTAADLTNPHSLMGALFQVFDRLGICRDYILSPPPDEISNQHVIYYWDLLPVINMTRVINYLLSSTPRANITISINYFIAPLPVRSHSILLVFLNLLIFNESRLFEIKADEEAVFSKTNQVQLLDDKKNKLSSMLQEHVLEKAKREERCEMLDSHIKKLEEEHKAEKDLYDKSQLELEVVLKENKQAENVLEQKKGQRDALIAEIEKKKALRVYDADDIKAQAEQAAQNVQEAEEKLISLKETLMQKENRLKNLQAIRPNLSAADNLLSEIMKQWESLRDYEKGDLDSDSKEGELDVLNTEVSELEVQLAELKVARAEAANKREEAHAKRQNDRSLIQSNVREAEEKCKKCSERCVRVSQRTQQIKELSSGREGERAAALEELAALQASLEGEIKAMNTILLKKAAEAKKGIEEKLKIFDFNLVNSLHGKLK